MGEGTAHLDSAYERAVNAAIWTMGITRIIVHRGEALKAFDRVPMIAHSRLR
ncbi:hypothetical protein [Sphingomonas sp. PP-CE-3G-477]|uniref:hypothetical protein n=2 Tax=unclassified Sphingomonas TaxID=196159 RepID=UPI0015E62E85|nr:hypothetical protein [Sphingomonas sp. PP-CE-3G-477]